MSDRLAVIQGGESINELQEISNKVKGLIGDFNKLIDVTDKINAGLLKGTPKDTVNAIKEADKATKEYMKTLMEQQKIELEIPKAKMEDIKNARIRKKAMQEEAEERRRETEARKAQKEAEAKIRAEEKAGREQAKKELKEFEKTQKEALKQKVNNTPYKIFAREVLEAKNKAKDLRAEMILLEQKFKNNEISAKQYKEQISRLGKEFTEAKLRAIGLDQQLKKIDASVGDHHRNVGNYQSTLGKMGKGLGGIATQVAGGMGIYMGVEMVGQLATQSYQTIKELDALNYTMKEVFKTNEEVSFQKQYLTEMANKYGLEIKELTNSYIKFIVASQGTSLEGNPAMQIFDSFAGAGAKLGRSSEQMKGIYRALEQMMSKGKIQAEELRGQLGDRMSAAFKLFADAIGVTTAELDKLLKEGKVFSDDVLPRVAENLRKAYDLDNVKNIDTLAAAQNKLSNAWTDFLDTLATNKDFINGIASTLKFATMILQEFLDLMISDGAEADGVLQSYAETIDAVLDLINALTDGAFEGNKAWNFLKMTINETKGVFILVQGAVAQVADTINILIEAVKGLANIFKENSFDGMFKAFDEMERRTAEASKKLNALHKENQLYASGNESAIKNYENQQKFEKSRQEALKNNENFFIHNNIYRWTKNGKSTNLRASEYLVQDGKFVKRQQQNTGDLADTETGKGIDWVRTRDAERAKKKKGGRERNTALDEITALKENEITALKEKRLKNLISEKEYLNEYAKIVLNHRERLDNLVQGKDKRMAFFTAKAKRQALEELEKTNKEIYELEKDHLSNLHDISQQENEKRIAEINNNLTMSSYEKLLKETEIDREMLDSKRKHYEELIALAQKYGQDTLKIEADRDKELNNQQDKINDKLSKLPDEWVKHEQDKASILVNEQNLSYEQQRQKILSLRISHREREYLLSVLEKDNAIAINDLEIKKLSIEKEQLETKKKLLGLLSQEDEVRLTDIKAQIEQRNADKIQQELNKKQAEIDRLREGLEPLRGLISNGLGDLGLDATAKQFDDMFNKILDNGGEFALDMKDIIASAGALASDIAGQMIKANKERTIQALDEQLEKSQEQTDAELSLINSRLEALNGLSQLTQEQEEEKIALQDEAIVVKEQQAQREKMIETQKAKAEQRASAQQALINGALAATQTLAKLGVPFGLIPAGIALAFGALQSGLIMSRNPVPQYFVGTQNAPKGWAWTDERGAELHTDKHGNIKDFGSNKGARLKFLEQGDKIYTAQETIKMIQGMDTASIGDDFWGRMVIKNIQAPVNINTPSIDYDKLAQKFGEQQDRIFKKYDKASVYEINGVVYMERGGKIPQEIGRAKKQKQVIKINRNERD